MYASGILFAVAPMPLLLAGLTQPFRRLVFAAAVNALIVWALVGPGAAVIFFVGIIPVLVAGREFLVRRQWTFARAVYGGFALELLMVLGLAFGAVIALGAFSKGWPHAFGQLRAQSDAFMDLVVQQSKTALDEAQLNAGEFKQEIWRQLPSSVGIGAFLVVFGNLYLLMRVVTRGQGNPLRGWRMPMGFAWPTILAGFGMLFLPDFTAAGILSNNFFRFASVLYGIQGLAILGVALDRVRVGGLLRVLLSITAVLAAGPVLVGFGFFDLWFDFRAKLRQS